MEHYILSNGIKIPKIAFGTWQIDNGPQAVETIKYALQAGYTHVDTAAVYGNEESVGKAIKASGIERENLFITSKVWNTDRGYDATLAAFEKTMQLLDTDYLDLYLIHWPANALQFDNWKDLNAGTWKALEYLYQSGKVKAIGVSNFLVSHLEALLETAIVKPMVNQIEFHPGYEQLETVDFCKKQDILVEAWSPMGRGKVLSNEFLVETAAALGITVAQLCIAYALNNDILPLPKSVTPQNISSNLEALSVRLPASVLEKIAAMERVGFSELHPNEVTF